ncbi:MULTISPECIES: hypothetical protein [Corynebacterium]|uniref:Secreted protein n=2 Tax=Corynebacterium TaxID=1716 RepID=A0AAP4C031_9CORY|nr:MULTISPECIES: hypothetical protein [Corynebacterium]EEI14512.1 hypothetical protein HMPREF0276_1422 [Corynebacterium accolens ATCC 49725]EFM44258.1 hypothetical protein HMPREF0277_0691 [Corynebacterium accolens ATCC 49726]ERS55377.1 hypothetical protein HMPREF1267_00692 [Corynebacterium sp. KPL1824]ERS61383.1 hypothetical protein HMPREF1261_01062 [Corynebacterium sp. KPL1818]MDK4209294.1 hypothetical protein [Corynebacterium accolens]
MKAKSIASAIAALSLVAVPVAHASDFGGDFELPQRWNDDFKPGTHCATPGENSTYVTAKRRWFKQTDAASVANHNAEPLPVKHTVSKARTETVQVSGSVRGEGDLAKILTKTYGFNYVSEQHWKINQVVGPYTLPANSQGKLVWGFTMLDTDGQDVRCNQDQVWETVGKPYSATVPESRYSELRLEDAPDWS